MWTWWTVAAFASGVERPEGLDLVVLDGTPADPAAIAACRAAGACPPGGVDPQQGDHALVDRATAEAYCAHTGGVLVSERHRGLPRRLGAGRNLVFGESVPEWMEGGRITVDTEEGWTSREAVAGDLATVRCLHLPEIAPPPEGVAPERPCDPGAKTLERPPDGVWTCGGLPIELVLPELPSWEVRGHERSFGVWAIDPAGAVGVGVAWVGAEPAREGLDGWMQAQLDLAALPELEAAPARDVQVWGAALGRERTFGFRRRDGGTAFGRIRAAYVDHFVVVWLMGGATGSRLDPRSGGFEGLVRPRARAPQLVALPGGAWIVLPADAWRGSDELATRGAAMYLLADRAMGLRIQTDRVGAEACARTPEALAAEIGARVTPRPLGALAGSRLTGARDGRAFEVWIVCGDEQAYTMYLAQLPGSAGGEIGTVMDAIGASLVLP